MSVVLVTILGYIALQLAFGFWLARRMRNETDYLLAGRSLGPWLATFTVFATWFGAETCIGAAGEAYRGGLAATRADPFGYALGILATGLLLAVPLWKRGVITLADLFRSRYGPGVERLAAIIMIPTSLLWAAAQIRAFGQVLAASSELGVMLAITLAAAVVIVYTAAGGLLADAVSDLVQGLVLIAGIAAIAVLFITQDGLAHLAAVPMERWRPLEAQESAWALAEAMAVPVFGTMAAQELAARVLAARSPGLARGATIGAAFLYLAVGLVPVTLGLVAANYIGALDEPEQVLIHYAQRYLAAPLYVLFVGALVSAILSTVDSALLVAGSLAAHNLVLPLKPGLSDAAKLRFNRFAVVCFGAIAYGLALASEGVYALVEEASSLGTAGTLVILLFALWGARLGGRASAYAALVVGLAVYVGGQHVLELEYPYITSVAAAFLAYVLFAPLSRDRR